MCFSFMCGSILRSNERVDQPVSIFRSVDFPEPAAPRTTVIWCRKTLRLTCCMCMLRYDCSERNTGHVIHRRHIVGVQNAVYVACTRVVLQVSNFQDETTTEKSGCSQRASCTLVRLYPKQDFTDETTFVM